MCIHSEEINVKSGLKRHPNRFDLRQMARKKKMKKIKYKQTLPDQILFVYLLCDLAKKYLVGFHVAGIALRMRFKLFNSILIPFHTD